MPATTSLTWGPVVIPIVTAVLGGFLGALCQSLLAGRNAKKQWARQEKARREERLFELRLKAYKPLICNAHQVFSNTSYWDFIQNSFESTLLMSETAYGLYEKTLQTSAQAPSLDMDAFQALCRELESELHSHHTTNEVPMPKRK